MEREGARINSQDPPPSQKRARERNTKPRALLPLASPYVGGNITMLNNDSEIKYKMNKEKGQASQGR